MLSGWQERRSVPHSEAHDATATTVVQVVLRAIAWYTTVRTKVVKSSGMHLFTRSLQPLGWLALGGIQGTEMQPGFDS
eukprot:COSAG06_NODE_42436_length_381_cov_2.489362_1_plen_77_part_10